MSPIVCKWDEYSESKCSPDLFCYIFGRMPVNRVLYNLEYVVLQDKEARLWVTGFEQSTLFCFYKAAAECRVIKS